VNLQSPLKKVHPQSHQPCSFNFHQLQLPDLG
jgi:hypothetical protein